MEHGKGMSLHRYRRFAWFALAFTLFVIVWGAFVRATGSGAGCGNDWPTCHGALIPETSSAATFIEYVHRVTSGLAFLVVVALWLTSRALLPRGHAGRRAAGVAVLFMVTESAVGAALVLLHLVADNSSLARAGWMALHLANTNVLLAALALAATWATPEPLARPASHDGDAGKIWFFVLLSLLLLVGITGAITALGDTLFPAASLREGLQQDVSPTAHLLVQVRAAHPLVAIVTALLVLNGARHMRAGATTPSAGKRYPLLVALVGLQVVGGFVNLLLLAPIALQLAHLLLADVVWIVLVLHGAPLLWTSAPAHVAGRPTDA